jgi:hypothetical protein
MKNCVGTLALLIALTFGGMDAAQAAAPNHLGGQSSVYLARAAGQPVDWYPWGAEAFKRAKTSRQDFMVGRNMKIIELNGVTSEATHMYDPKLRLFDAYRALFQQWRIAFEIGDRNRARGTQSASVGDLLDASREYSRLA